MTKVALVIALIAAQTAMSQEGTLDLQQMIYLPASSCSIWQFRQRLDSQYAVSIHYIAGSVNIDKVINFRTRWLSLSNALDRIRQQTDLDYTIVNRAIVLLKKEAVLTWFRIIDQLEEPVQGVEIIDKQDGTHVYSSDSAGQFSLLLTGPRTLVLRHKQFEQMNATVHPGRAVTFSMTPHMSPLPGITVPGSWESTSKKQASPMAMVAGKDLPQSSSASAFSYLQGRVPGLLVNSSNGTPGSVEVMTIYGPHHIPEANGSTLANKPLIMINNIRADNLVLSRVGSMAGSPEAVPGIGTSIFDFLDPYDIESITAYKGADATSRFGMAGANGVIHIITRGSNASRQPWISAGISTGIAYSSLLSPLMNIQQYYRMRRESILGAGFPFDASTAPELFLWDSTRSTNFGRVVLGNISRVANGRMAISGGRESFDYMLSFAFRKSGSVVPGDFHNRQFTHLGHFNYKFPDLDRLRIFYLAGSADYEWPAVDPVPYTLLAPNAPPLKDSAGLPVFEENGLSFTNPLAAFRNRYQFRSFLLKAGLQFDGRVFRTFNLHTNLGFSYTRVSELALLPIAANIPATGLTGSSTASPAQYNSWIVESILEYRYDHNGQTLLGLQLGSNLQRQSGRWELSYRMGYPNDALLMLQQAAPETSSQSGRYDRRLFGLFLSGDLALRHGFLFNLNARMDKLHEQGINSRPVFYYGAGGNWTFCKKQEPRDSSHTRLLRSGKLYASIGSSGSDYFGDPVSSGQYTTGDNGNAIRPQGLRRPDLRPSHTWKMELGTELKLLQLFSLTLGAYRHLTTDQVISMMVPAQTGFSSIAAINNPGVVENRGLEFILEKKRKEKEQHKQQEQKGRKSRLCWTSSLQLTLASNRLRRFDDIDRTSFASELVVGQSLLVEQGFRWKGVNPNTGLHEFEDLNQDGRISLQGDMTVIGHQDAPFYGSFSNELSWKGFQLSIELDFRKQRKESVEINALVSTPGGLPPSLLSNQLTLLEDRWQKPGDIARHQKLSVYPDEAAAQSNNLYRASDAMLPNASYIRLRMVSLSYRLPDLPGKKASSSHSSRGNNRVYIEATNLHTFTPYKGGDPTIEHPGSVPSLTTIMVGVSITVNQK